jgi:hypothetical protein
MTTTIQQIDEVIAYLVGEIYRVCVQEPGPLVHAGPVATTAAAVESLANARLVLPKHQPLTPAVERLPLPPEINGFTFEVCDAGSGGWLAEWSSNDTFGGGPRRETYNAAALDAWAAAGAISQGLSPLD